SQNNQNVNFEVLQQCFEQERQRSGGGCFSQFRQQMCASSPGQMIDRSETFQGQMDSNGGGFGGGGFGGGGFFRRMMQNRMDGGEDNQRRGFFGRFGQSQGSEMFQCIHKCMEDSPNRGKGFMCYASLGCGVRKPQQEQFMQMMQQCRGGRDEKRQRICQCLTAAGASEMCDQLHNGGPGGFGRGFGFMG
uniref:Uncharacterized protein n=1 Tax=Acrobeloides nanus TaxID=290746 RepID=A0A914D521_9BILA